MDRLNRVKAQAAEKENRNLNRTLSHANPAAESLCTVLLARSCTLMKKLKQEEERRKLLERQEPPLDLIPTRVRVSVRISVRLRSASESGTGSGLAAGELGLAQ